MHFNAQARQRFAPGEILCRQGEPGDCAFVLESGRVEVLVTQPDGVTVSLGTRGPGCSIGEMAIIDNGARLATVRAIEECQALVITRAELARRLANSDPVVRLFTGIVVARCRELLRRAAISFDDTSPLSGEDVEASLLRESAGLERLRLAGELRAAIVNNQLSLCYQPMVAVASGRIDGFEALLRWHHPVRGVISPDEFIPLAEESGQIIELTRWALGEACRALGRLEKACGGLGPFHMSVNFSSEDLASQDFVERISETLAQASVPACRIQLEITERAMMSHAASVQENLARCRAEGFNIAIDDFGTGYSSLSYLNAYPIDTLKIDRSFIVGMHRDEDAFGLVRSIIGLAKTLRLSVVAEGVETVDDVRTLRTLDCDHAQGYFFAQPLAESDVAGFLAAWDPDSVTV